MSWLLVFVFVVAGCAGVGDRGLATGTNEFDPAVVEVGDRIVGLEIVALEVSPVVDRTEWVGRVDFDGRVRLSGRAAFHQDPELDLLCFFPDDASSAMLPRFSSDERYAWFCFTNQEHARDLIGITQGEGIEATVVVDEYRYLYSFSDVFNQARLVELVR